jgi:aryl-alcohol dehydrogenase-like predicted oxidoreductase
LTDSLTKSSDLGYPRYECLQPHYNLLERSDFEGELEALCLQEHIGVITYFSLAGGFLTGKYRTDSDLASRARGSFVQRYLNARGMRVLAALDKVSERTGASPAQLALAWLMTRRSVTAPIASATSVTQLNELLQSTEVELDQAAVVLLDAAGG